MNLAEFRRVVANNPGCGLRVQLSSGTALLSHFHVTEVGRVEKSFVDCGGVRRVESRCVLQTLVAGDVDHRLDSTKLAKILSLADELGLSGESTVDIEHQERSISVDVIDRVCREGDQLVISLKAKQTACLAVDACGISPADQLPVVDGAAGPCCTDPGCC